MDEWSDSNRRRLHVFGSIFFSFGVCGTLTFLQFGSRIPTTTLAVSTLLVMMFFFVGLFSAFLLESDLDFFRRSIVCVSTTAGMACVVVVVDDAGFKEFNDVLLHALLFTNAFFAQHFVVSVARPVLRNESSTNAGQFPIWHLLYVTTGIACFASTVQIDRDAFLFLILGSLFGVTTLFAICIARLRFEFAPWLPMLTVPFVTYCCLPREMMVFGWDWSLGGMVATLVATLLTNSIRFSPKFFRLTDKKRRANKCKSLVP
jgi:hypothetical protein